MAAKFGRGPLHMAARSDAVTAELLAQHAAAVDAKDNHGFTPLYTASMFGHAASVSSILPVCAVCN